jgi:hypothetical protein
MKLSKYGNGQLIYNRGRRETGVVRHTYEKTGPTMHVESVPALPSLMGASSDWGEDVLELEVPERQYHLAISDQ